MVVGSNLVSSKNFIDMVLNHFLVGSLWLTKSHEMFVTDSKLKQMKKVSNRFESSIWVLNYNHYQALTLP